MTIAATADLGSGLGCVGFEFSRAKEFFAVLAEAAPWTLRWYWPHRILVASMTVAATEDPGVILPAVDLSSLAVMAAVLAALEFGGIGDGFGCGGSGGQCWLC